MMRILAANTCSVLKLMMIFLCLGVIGCSSPHEQTPNSEVIVRYAWVDPSMETWDIGLVPDLAPKGFTLSGSKLGKCMSDAINEKHMYSCVELYIDVNGIDFSLGASLTLWCEFFDQYEIPYIVSLGWSENNAYKKLEVKHYYRSGGWDRIEWHDPDEFTFIGLSPNSPSKVVPFDETLKEISEAPGGMAYIISINSSVLDDSPARLAQLVEVLNSRGRSIPYQIRIKRVSPVI